jgi:hypothetical protein
MKVRLEYLEKGKPTPIGAQALCPQGEILIQPVPDTISDRKPNQATLEEIKGRWVKARDRTHADGRRELERLPGGTAVSLRRHVFLG